MATVSNPYTFKITANKTVKATISMVIPITETELGDGIWYETDVGEYVDYNEDNEVLYSFTVPSGVNVIKMETDYTTTSGDGYFTAYYKKGNGNWAEMPSGFTYSGTKYVGVTAGTTYSIGYTIQSRDDRIQVLCKCYYSQSINSQTPNFTI